MKPCDLLNECLPKKFTGSVFRAIYTSFPTRNLYSDIGFREGDPDFEIAMFLADSDLTIDRTKPQQTRPFQYSDLENFLHNYTSEVIDRDEILYPLRNALKGRFSDGTFGVFYASLEEATSLAEVAFHFVEECRYEMKMSPEVFTSRVVDKRIVQLDANDPKAVDVRNFHGNVPELTAELLDYCQELGRLLREQDIAIALTPSARASGGTCTPIFFERALPMDQTRTIRYYHFKFDRTGLSIKKSDVNQTDWAIPGTWKLPQSGPS